MIFLSCLKQIKKASINYYTRQQNKLDALGIQKKIM